MKKNDIILFVFTWIVLWGFIFVVGKIISRPTDREREVVEESSLSEWEILQLAIIKTESRFDTLAVGKKGDWGVYQITPIYVEDANRIIGEEKYIHEDAFSPEKSNEMFGIVQGHYNPDKDIEKAIALHNPTATVAYSLEVRRNMEWVREYEKIRKIIRK